MLSWPAESLPKNNCYPLNDHSPLLSGGHSAMDPTMLYFACPTQWARPERSKPLCPHLSGWARRDRGLKNDKSISVAYFMSSMSKCYWMHLCPKCQDIGISKNKSKMSCTISSSLSLYLNTLVSQNMLWYKDVQTPKCLCQGFGSHTYLTNSLDKYVYV